MIDGFRQSENGSFKNLNTFEELHHSVKTANFEHEQCYSTMGVNKKKNPNIYHHEVPAYEKTEKKYDNRRNKGQRGDNFALNYENTIKKKPNQFFSFPEDQILE